MTKRVNRILKGMAFLFCIIIVMLAGGYFYLKTDHGQKYIQAKIGESIPGSVVWDNARISLLTGRLDLKKVLIKDPSNEEVAGFDRLFVEYSWLSLLRGNLTMKEVLLEKPWTKLRTEKTGGLNLGRTFIRATPDDRTRGKEVAKKRGYRLPINIIIEKFNLTHGSLRFETADKNTVVILQEIDVTARADLLKQSGKITLQVGRSNIKSPKIRAGIDKCTLEAKLNKGRIDPLIARIQSANSSLTLSGTVRDIFDTPSINAMLDLTASLQEIRQNFNLKQTLTGQAVAQLSITGTPDNPDATLRLDYGGGTILENRVDLINLDLRMKDHLVTINTLKVKAADGIIDGRGKMDLRKAFLKGFLSPERNLEAVTYELSLEQKGMNLEKLRNGAQNWKGIVNSHLSFYGMGFSPKSIVANASLKIDGEKITTDQFVTPVGLQVKSDIEMKRGIATLKKLKIQIDRSELNADGHFDILSQVINAKLSLIAPDLAGTLSPLGFKNVQGNVGLQATVFGSIKQPLFELDLHGDGLRFKDITFGGIFLNAGLDKSGILKISECKVKNRNSVFRITGTAHVFDKTSEKLNGNPAFNLNITGDTILLEDFTKRLKGKVSITGSLEGNLAQPRGTVTLHGKEFDLDGQKLNKINLTAFVDGGKIRFDPIQIFVTPAESIEGKGLISLQKEYDLSLTSKGISLHNIEKIQKQKMADGTVLFDIAGHGTFDNPRLSGNIFVNNVRIRGKSVEDFHVKVDLHNHVARLSGKLNFDLNGSFDLKTKNFSTSAIFNETDLSAYCKIAGQPDISGKLSGKIEASGNSQSIKTINADINVSALDLYYRETEFLNTRSLKLTVKDKEISLPESIIMLPPEGRITVSGKGNFDGSAAFRAEGTIPLNIAGRFVEDLADINGNLSISSKVDGTFRHPKINADIELIKIGCTVPVLLQKLHDLNGKIRINPETITLDGIRGHIDKGSFDLAGRIQLREEFQPDKISVKVAMTALPVQVPDTLDLLLNSQLQIEGTQEKSIIKGEIILLEGTYYKDINLSLLRGIGQRGREEAPSPKEITHPFLKNTGFDISIKQRNHFLIDNKLAHLEVNPDLRILGTINNPILRGRAAVQSGIIRYQGKTFVIKKGIINFLNPYKIDPTFDIQSEVKVREWLIFLEVSGTREQLIFKLTSEPPEEHGDILSLLLLGKTTRELIANEGGTTESTKKMLAGLIASTSEDNIKEATGLDIFEVDSSDKNNGGAYSGVKVTIGKELSKRLTVKHSVESKEGQIVQRAIAEYKFLENILARGFQDTQGIYGGELQFRLEFR
ncbi:MAG: translocation/assembly module TamB domain-containing protein [Syntrophales bacterium]|nr:translocation/assembly module TamB domain-containing protein [Syntrophales bacterium]